MSNLLLGVFIFLILVFVFVPSKVFLRLGFGSAKPAQYGTNLELAREYYSGTTDKYSSDGKLIPGVKPNIKKALKYYKKCADNKEWMGALELASLYKNETETEFYNEEEAKNLCFKIMREMEPTNPYYNFIYSETNKMLTNILRPKNPFEEQSNPYAYFNPNAFYSQIPAKKKIRKRQNPDQEENKISKVEVLNIVFSKDPYKNPNTNNYRNDPQNTHDSSVVNTIKRSYDRIKSTTVITSDPYFTISEIKEEINKNPVISKEKKENAMKTLESIERNSNLVSYINEKEINILNLIWNRIKMKNGMNYQNAVENLINNLADSVEYGNVVCTSGRVNRVIDSLNGIDSEVEIKPDWAINSEMMSKAAAVRNEMENVLTKEEKDAINSIEPSKVQERICEDFSRKLKAEIRNRLSMDYVNSGIMTERMFNNEIDKWIDEI